MPIVIEGCKPLKGEVEVLGAKNAALPIIAATVLTADECLLENVPYIEDIRSMVSVLHSMGVAARFEGPNVLRIKATRISRATLPLDLATKMRASFLIVGPLLARFGQAEAPHPGGCAIGTRPVSVDLKGFQKMGSEVTIEGPNYVMKAPRLKAERLILDYPSHTGTENILMAACLADGVTTIENASIEPEVVDLASFLCAMGARIEGAPEAIGAGGVVVLGEQIHPVAHGHIGHGLVAIHLVSPDGRVVGRVRAMERHEQEERLSRIAPPQEIERLRYHEIGGVQMFGLVPRTRHIRVAVDAVIEIVGVAPQLLTQPGVIVIHQVVAAPAFARKV